MSPANTSVVETGLISYSLPSELRQALSEAQRDWDSAANTARLWKADPSLWGVVNRQLNDISKFKALSAEVKEDGFAHVLLLGTDGSALAAQVLNDVFGKQHGSPTLMVVDSLDPMRIRKCRLAIRPGRTLFCVSSNTDSDMGIAPLVRYFFEETRAVIGDRAGQNFVAITDAESKLALLANELGFRRLFSSEMGARGCYSAFSDLGLVPFAAAGHDAEKLLKHTERMLRLSRNESSHENPAVTLGLILATSAAKFGYRKVTLRCSQSIEGLGSWIEQSVSALNLITIDREPISGIENYNSDRIFIYIRYSRDPDKQQEMHISALEDAGKPVIRMEIEDLRDLGQILFQWQMATTVASIVMRIDPCKQFTAAATISQVREIEVLNQGGLKLFTDPENAAFIARKGESLGGLIRRHLDRLRPGDFFALLAYFSRMPEHEELLSGLRKQIMESKQAATVLGFGPHFQQNAGRAFENELNSGVFLQITCDEAEDIPIPASHSTFGSTKAKQAQRDFQSLAEQKARILRVHLGSDLMKGLQQLRDLVCAAIEH